MVSLNQIGSWTSINGVIAENTPYDQLSFEFILGVPRKTLSLDNGYKLGRFNLCWGTTRD